MVCPGFGFDKFGLWFGCCVIFLVWRRLRSITLGNPVQREVTAGAGHAVMPAEDACRDAELACGLRKLTLRIEIQRHPAQLG